MSVRLRWYTAKGKFVSEGQTEHPSVAAARGAVLRRYPGAKEKIDSAGDDWRFTVRGRNVAFLDDFGDDEVSP
jgi:hypothetical protein